MKVDILTKTIDINKLNNAVDDFNNKHKGIKPYIFMSKDTIDRLEEETNIFNAKLEYYDFCFKNNLQGHVSVYHGYKCYRDDDLAFGEVVLR